MAVQDFDHRQAQEVFSFAGGNQPEKENDRLRGISGDLLDRVAVIIEIAGIEAGCGGVFV
jgi:hypothetical protein